MSKNEKMTGFKFFRWFLGGLFRFWYKPTILGKENIPNDGPIVVVGNHINIMDQCNVIIATKRCIHYMAKKEYFDRKYKEGKFPWFFRAAGCIPVDRSIHDEEAKESALEVLNNGDALGLFPEGTRNKPKAEKVQDIYDLYFKDSYSFEDFYKKIKINKTSQINYMKELLENKIINKDEFVSNIFDCDNYLKSLVKDKKITEDDYYEHIFLPFKFGAVSMAHKTNAKIVPFVISDNYKFRSNKLLVIIGKPIDPLEDYEKANNILRQEMIDLMKEINKNNEK